MSDSMKLAKELHKLLVKSVYQKTGDFQQCGILSSVDVDEPVHTHLKLRNSKCSVSGLTVIEYSSD